MTDETSALSVPADEQPPAASGTVRVCKRPNCEVEYEPRAHNQRYCSLRCKRWVSNHSPRHPAAKARHDARRRESGLKAMQDARWYANGGFFKQYQAWLRRRIAERTAYLEHLKRQDAAATGERDALGRIWR